MASVLGRITEWWSEGDTRVRIVALAVALVCVIGLVGALVLTGVVDPGTDATPGDPDDGEGAEGPADEAAAGDSDGDTDAEDGDEPPGDADDGRPDGDGDEPPDGDEDEPPDDSDDPGGSEGGSPGGLLPPSGGDDEASASPTVEREGLDAYSFEAQNAAAGESVRFEFPATDRAQWDDVRLEALEVTVDEETAVEGTVVQLANSPEGLADAEPSLHEQALFDVEETAANGSIDEVTLEFALEGQRIDEGANVTVYRHDEDWERLESRRGDGDGTVLATSPGFSQFSVQTEDSYEPSEADSVEFEFVNTVSGETEGHYADFDLRVELDRDDYAEAEVRTEVGSLEVDTRTVGQTDAFVVPVDRATLARLETGEHEVGVGVRFEDENGTPLGSGTATRSVRVDTELDEEADAEAAMTSQLYRPYRERALDASWWDDRAEQDADAAASVVNGWIDGHLAVVPSPKEVLLEYDRVPETVRKLNRGWNKAMNVRDLGLFAYHYAAGARSAEVSWTMSDSEEYRSIHAYLEDLDRNSAELDRALEREDDEAVDALVLEREQLLESLLEALPRYTDDVYQSATEPGRHFQLKAYRITRSGAASLRTLALLDYALTTDYRTGSPESYAAESAMPTHGWERTTLGPRTAACETGELALPRFECESGSTSVVFDTMSHHEDYTVYEIETEDDGADVRVVGEFADEYDVFLTDEQPFDVPSATGERLDFDSRHGTPLRNGEIDDAGTSYLVVRADGSVGEYHVKAHADHVVGQEAVPVRILQRHGPSVQRPEVDLVEHPRRIELAETPHVVYASNESSVDLGWEVWDDATHPDDVEYRYRIDRGEGFSEPSDWEPTGDGRIDLSFDLDDGVHRVQIEARDADNNTAARNADVVVTTERFQTYVTTDDDPSSDDVFVRVVPDRRTELVELEYRELGEYEDEEAGWRSWKTVRDETDLGVLEFPHGGAYEIRARAAGVGGDFGEWDETTLLNAGRPDVSLTEAPSYVSTGPGERERQRMTTDEEVTVGWELSSDLWDEEELEVRTRIGPDGEWSDWRSTDHSWRDLDADEVSHTRSYAEGVWQVGVEVRNPAGLTTRDTVDFVVDRTAPEVDVRAEGGDLHARYEGETSEGLRRLEVEMETVDGLEWRRIDTESWVRGSFEEARSSIAPGEHQLRVRGVDYVGNVGEWDEDAFTVHELATETDVDREVNGSGDWEREVSSGTVRASLDGRWVTGEALLEVYAVLGNGTVVLIDTIEVQETGNQSWHVDLPPELRDDVDRLGLRVENGSVYLDSFRTFREGPAAPEITVEPAEPEQWETTTFSLADTGIPAEGVDEVWWDLTGDGQRDQLGRTVHRAYTEPGNRTVSVTVADHFGRETSAQRRIHVEETPVDVPGPSALAGEGTVDDPYVVTRVEELQVARQAPDAHYVLGNDVWAGHTAEWHDGAGFEPIGNESEPFTGSFDGRGHEVRALHVDRPGESGVGLFGVSEGRVSAVDLPNATVTGDEAVGALVGDNRGELRDVDADGTVAGASDVGGLAGRSDGTVVDASATGVVEARGDSAGGLVGANAGAIAVSHADATVSGASARIGGLVGDNAGTVRATRALGSVTASSDDPASSVGGLVGANAGGVSESYAAAAIDASGAGNGLVGANDGSIVHAAWDVDAAGTDASPGGLGVRGLTSANLTGAGAADALAGFDFDATWTTTDGYPALDAPRSRPPASLEAVLDGMTGSGTAADPYRITSVRGLQAMAADPSAHYVLADDVDASETAAWPTGFEPVGSADAPFEGSLDGRGHVVAGLTVDDPTADRAGLFGVAEGTVEDLRVRDATVRGADGVGALAGRNDGTVTDVDATCTVAGEEAVGGLVGRHGGDLSASGVDCTVEGATAVGGAAGESDGDLRSVDADVAVRATGDAVGGVAGESDGDLRSIDADVTVRATGDAVGGVAGRATGSVTDASVEGDVTGGSSVGGALGDSEAAATDLEVEADVEGTARVGGAVGANAGSLNATVASGTVRGAGDAVGGVAGETTGSLARATSTVEVVGLGNRVGGVAGASDGSIANVTAEGSVRGTDRVGGLVGESEGPIRDARATADVEGASAVGGAVGASAGDLRDVEIDALVAATGDGVGGAVGRNRGSIQAVTASGEVTNASDAVGGIAGASEGSIAASESTVTVRGEARVGGLVGRNDGAIERSSAAGVVRGDGTALGGFAGHNAGEIRAAVARGTVSLARNATEAPSTASFVGENEGTVVEVFATGERDAPGDGGGLVAEDGGIVLHGYWDVDATAANASDGGAAVAGHESASMTGPSARETLVGFDFERTWTTTDGAPELDAGRTDRPDDLETVLSSMDGDGSADDPYRITSVAELQAVDANRSAHYVLVDDVDATPARSWRGGFEPIGSVEDPFAGSLDGGGHAIRGLLVDRPRASGVGLFAAANGSVSDLAIEDAIVRGGEDVGTLAGRSEGEVADVAVDCVVASDGQRVGGLAGRNAGDVAASEASCRVDGGGTVGGVLGENDGTVRESGADGAVRATGDDVGGAVGRNAGELRDATVAGDVEATGDRVGGAVGSSTGTLAAIRSNATVRGERTVGGVVGQSGGTLVGAGATGSVTGEGTELGGLAGRNEGRISAAYVRGGVAVSDGHETAADDRESATAATVGGLVGANDGEIAEAYAAGSLDVAPSDALVGDGAGTVLHAYWDEAALANATDANATAGSGDATGADATGADPGAVAAHPSVEELPSAALTGANASEHLVGFDFRRTWTTTDGHPALDADWSRGPGDREAVLEELPGTGTADDPYRIGSVEALQAIDTNRSAHYELAEDVDASPAATWIEGFEPIGSADEPFAGSLDGAGHEITGLQVDRPGEADVGLFAATEGTVANLTVADATVRGDETVGGLAGRADGTVRDATVDATVAADGGTVGGLAGTASGDLDGVDAGCTVDAGGDVVGGIAGAHAGTVNASRADCSVAGASTVGGAVGHAEGSLTDVRVDAAVRGEARVGGLVGHTEGRADFVGANGSVRAGGTAVGGLAGRNDGRLSVAYARTDVSTRADGGADTVAGLVGRNDGVVTEAYAAGALDAPGAAGLVAAGDGSVVHGYWDATASGTGSSAGGRTIEGLSGSAMTGDGAAERMVGFDFGATWTTTADYPQLVGTPGGAPEDREAVLEELPGTGTADDPYRIETVAALQAVDAAPGAHYELAGDVDASPAATWTDGFEPIGSADAPFTGTFDGAGHAVTGLQVDRPTEDDVGLFAATDGAVRNLTVADATVRGASTVGALAGRTDGEVAHVTTAGTVAAEGDAAGGLAGRNGGEVLDATADVRVVGDATVGGLFGRTAGPVERSVAEGSVVADGGPAGGLAAENAGNVSVAYAAVDLETAATTAPQVGGLIGANDGVIGEAYASGDLGDAPDAGGLVGEDAGTVQHAYWDVDATGVEASAAGEGLPADAMTGDDAAEQMVGFDFGATWSTTVEHPELASQRSGRPADLAAVLAETPGAGTADDPHRIATVEELQAMAADRSAHYVLADDVNASATATWENGFAPIGDADEPFTGTFDGDGHDVAGLYVDRPLEPAVGLFGATNGTVDDVTLSDAVVRGADDVGALAGVSDGTIANAAATGDVSGTDRVGGLVGHSSGELRATSAGATVAGAEAVGGLVGRSDGTVVDASTVPEVTGERAVGGLIGANEGAVADANARGDVTGNRSVGGLIGTSAGSVNASSADVTVQASGDAAGGLIGASDGDLTAVEATGDVDADGDAVGGLVGESVGDLADAEATGRVTAGGQRVGGLVGTSDGNVTDATAVGDVHAEGRLVGGLVGESVGDLSDVEATGDVDAGGPLVGGLIGDHAGDLRVASASGDVVADGGRVGGLIGASEGRVERSRATGTVTAAGTEVGGLAGSNGATVADAVAHVDVAVQTNETDDAAAGGLIGSNAGTVEAAFAVGALDTPTDGNGLVGEDAGTVTDAYWDVDVSGRTASAGDDVTGLSTDAMTGDASVEAMSGLDFEQSWSPTGGYPELVEFRAAEPEDLDAVLAAAAGSGTEADPYRISSLEELQAVDANRSAHYELVDDLDGRATRGWSDGFVPIGDADDPFTGSFDGRNHTVTGLSIARPGGEDVGLFAVLEGEVTSLTLADVDVRGDDTVGALAGTSRGEVAHVTVDGSVDGRRTVGGVVGDNAGTLRASASEADVNGTEYVGGVAGWSTGNVTSVSATVSVAGVEIVGGGLGGQRGTVTDLVVEGEVVGNESVGGLAGANSAWQAPGRIERSIADVDVHGYREAVGGLVGSNDGTVSASIARGNVTADYVGDEETSVGGLLGSNSGAVSDVYFAGTIDAADAGGLVGDSRRPVPGGYWDVELSGVETSAAGTGRTTDELTGPDAAETLPAFDFRTTWTATEGYPELATDPGDGAAERPDDLEAVLAAMDGDGSADDPYRITTVEELQAMHANRSAHYVLADDVDASATVEWDGGFQPVGWEDSDSSFGTHGTFTGHLDGQGHAVTGLRIDRPTAGDLGLVVENRGTIESIALEDAYVHGDDGVGALASTNLGTVEDARVDGLVAGSYGVGGLVGENGGPVSAATAAAEVRGYDTVGAVAGRNEDTVADVDAAGEVRGLGDSVGGAVGANLGNVTRSDAAGDVVGGAEVGGLVGTNEGNVTDATAAGAVDGGDYVGGVVGRNGGGGIRDFGTVGNATADGDVTGDRYVGGVIGDNDGLAAAVAASGVVSGGSTTGGAVGENDGTLRDVESVATVAVADGTVGGLAGRNDGEVVDSTVEVDVNGTSYVGGAVGSNGGDVVRTVVRGDVRGDVDAIAGLVGANDGEVRSSATLAAVQSRSEPQYTDVGAAGAVSENEGLVIRVFAAGEIDAFVDENGLVRSNDGGSYGEAGTVRDSYWDVDATGAEASAGDGAVGLGTDELTGESAADHLEGFDFVSTWATTSSYPEIDPTAGTDRPDLAAVHDAMAGSGTADDPYRVSSVEELQAIAVERSAHYVLVDDVDASASRAWRGGFRPVGTAAEPFDGSLDGRGNAVTGLWIDRPDRTDVGLFGVSNGTVEALDLEAVVLRGEASVGALAGTSGGTVEDVTVDAEVRGERAVGGLVGSNGGTVRDATARWYVDGSDEAIGGLVGENRGLVEGSRAASRVDGGSYAGGLVGTSNGTVVDSEANGTLSAGAYAGGLVGSNGGTVRDATATVRADVGGVSGGLVGENDGTIEAVAARGDVDGYGTSGGLVGENRGTIETAVARGDVGGGSATGGLVGLNEGDVEAAHAHGDVTSWRSGGGLVGENAGNLSQVYATGAASEESGLIAEHTGAVTAGYWDVNATGVNASAGGDAVVGLTTDELTGEPAVDHLEGFDFEATWRATDGYPELRDAPPAT